METVYFDDAVVYFVDYVLFDAVDTVLMRAGSESESFGDWVVCEADIAKECFCQIA